MKTHNLRILCNKISTKYTLTVSSRYCKWLGDFYLEASYPGENFIFVSKNDALKCLALAKQIKEDTDSILAEIQKARDKVRAHFNVTACKINSQSKVFIHASMICVLA